MVLGSAHFQPLSWNLRMKVALGAAKGLAYLHSPEAKVIYRDFKSSNILLDSVWGFGFVFGVVQEDYPFLFLPSLVDQLCRTTTRSFPILAWRKTAPWTVKATCLRGLWVRTAMQLPNTWPQVFIHHKIHFPKCRKIKCYSKWIKCKSFYCFFLWRSPHIQKRCVQLRSCSSRDADWATCSGQEPSPRGAEPHTMGEAVSSQQKKSSTHYRQAYTRPVRSKRSAESSHTRSEMPSDRTQAPARDEGSGGSSRTASRQHGHCDSRSSFAESEEGTGLLSETFAFAFPCCSCLVVNCIKCIDVYWCLRRRCRDGGCS